MKLKTATFFLTLFISSTVFGGDTLYFRLSNPWNTVKSPTGKYLRKCIKENNYYHSWDYNSNNILVTESFYSDTNFTKKLFCHKYFNEKKGYLEQTRCYENGRLSGYFVDYNEKGDTTAYQLYDNGVVIKEWSSEPQSNVAPFVMNEDPAEFPGGETAWREYLGNNLKYPDSLQNIKGQVLLKFIVNPKGTIESVEIIKSLHPLLDQEAIRVIMNSPKWRPAKQNGKKVQATRTQPINFG
ncbi:MAG: energy transducer TonB [Bacteroidetes bacterium]|nr:energy transducer TonB [Bacteroidota bacterium]